MKNNVAIWTTAAAGWRREIFKSLATTCKIFGLIIIGDYVFILISVFFYFPAMLVGCIVDAWLLLYRFLFCKIFLWLEANKIISFRIADIPTPTFEDLTRYKSRIYSCSEQTKESLFQLRVAEAQQQPTTKPSVWTCRANPWHCQTYRYSR